MDEDALEDNVAFVTGATSGIGRAAALELAAEGAHVALASRREDRLETVAEEVRTEHDREAIVVPTDVTDPEQVRAAVAETAETFGGVDVVVANAGLGVNEPVEDLSVEDFELMIDVNVNGMFYTAQAALPHLRESSGNLVFLGSFAGQYPRPNDAVYAATKWWTRGFALSLEGTVGDDDVAVTVVNPTEVRTEFGSETDDEMKDRFEPGEVTEPAEVAEAIAFAAKQRPPNTVSEIDLYRRDKFSHF
ncbi:SDR family oxidoreductase [Halopelagius longus]|uniref:NADP-dependent 3-hydroxy acid dehydrogenase YdfG n=1 Tax=Halopelagius longus TaxID=1236180 RepID=A0A1H1FFQ3_9EURY|nr:SDR family oxidoreductase [Halopelagius longus]RDI70119.1 SDR family oxidoreductase [Halopelagius longus]SDQ99842.1 NADP-dependent 3-hydroxy acid dehydrogenase YdfG [Halopelagius longus]